MRSIVEESYTDAFGKHVTSSPRAISRVREALGPTQARILEPVLVAWNGFLTRITLRAELSSPIHLRIITEEGDAKEIKVRSGDLEKNGGETTIWLRQRLRWGYHTLYLSARGVSKQALIISAPQKAYSHTGRRWGLFTPVYALNSSHSWGIGDLGDVHTFMHSAHSVGAGFVGTLPLLATYPSDPSPYSPVSMFMFNELFVDLSHEALSKALGASAAAARLKKERSRLNRMRRVDYSAVARLKHSVMRDLAQHLDYESDEETLSYAAFRVRKKIGRTVGKEHRDVRMHALAQNMMREQLSSISRDPETPLLYMDLPVGVSPKSYDTYRFARSFCDGLKVGAPPDPGFPTGQDWGFLPLHPKRIREEGYEYFIQSLRTHMRFADYLRIDHVMRFHRLYVIPKGLPCNEGVYIRYVPDEFYAILNLESRRNRCQVIGENLGTVEPTVNERLDRHTLEKMCIMVFNPGQLPNEKNNMAYLDTHDTPTFASLLDEEGFTRELRKLLRAQGHRPRTRKGMLDATLRVLAASAVKDICVNVENLWFEHKRQNLPGTKAKHNWRRKLAYSLDDPAFMRYLRRFSKNIVR